VAGERGDLGKGTIYTFFERTGGDQRITLFLAEKKGSKKCATPVRGLPPEREKPFNQHYEQGRPGDGPNKKEEPSWVQPMGGS